MGMIALSGQLICPDAAAAARVRAHLPEHVRLTRAEPGCLAFDVVPTADPLVWAVSERFADRAAFDAHQTRTAGSVWAAGAAGCRRAYEVTEAP